MIQQKLRDAGRLLIAARKISSKITEFSSLYHVNHCDTVVQAIRDVTKFNSTTKQFGAPSTASTLITLINSIGELLIIELMKADEREQESNVSRFLVVFKRDVKKKINKLAAVQKLKRQRETKLNLPTTSDIKTLMSYIDDKRDRCFTNLTKQYSFENWILLSKLTLMSLLLFNRKRVGDTQNMLLSDYYGREIISEHSDKSLLETVPENVKKLIESRMRIRGKLYQNVSALVKHNVNECIKIIIRYRKEAGIPEANQFLFAMPSKFGKIKTINACALFNKYSTLCGADNPSSLRGTKCRKHLATALSRKKLNDSVISNVARFMGHTEQIHRAVYRQNDLLNEVIQMSEILEEAQGNVNINTNTTSATNSSNGRKRKIQANIPEKKIKRKRVVSS